MTTKSPMTINGAQQLRDQLHRLKTRERPRVIEAIAHARSLGDLRENAEYSAAREQQSFIEGRIAEIEAKLAHAEIIDITLVNANGKVVFGSTVEICKLDDDQGITSYRIVGEDEADARVGLISIKSPVARALIGKTAGEVICVKAPGGEKEYEILSVRYE
ncbi:MAG: transcription elongation factor GreA [Gammaproteobacteria bacterium]